MMSTLTACGETLNPRFESPIVKFCKINSRYWSKQIEKYMGCVFVEGSLACSGPNYAFRTALIGKAIEKKLCLEPIVIFDHGEVNSEVRKIYESFEIKRFLVLENKIKEYGYKAMAIILAIFYMIFFGRKIINNPFGVAFGDIILGDLVYDDLLRVNKLYTVNKMKFKDISVLYAAFKLYFVYSYFFKKHKPSYTIVTHIQYVAYGILARLAGKYDSTLIISTDIDLYFCDNQFLGQPVIYHEVARHNMNNVLATMSDLRKDQLVEKSKSYLQARFRGKLEQIDIMLAYRNKRSYSESELRNELELNSNPIAVIMCHVFSDSPKSSISIFNNYFDWLSETLDFVRSQKSVNWIVKPHPSAADVYGEHGVVENMVTLMNEPHVKLVPGDLGTQSLADWTNYLITMSGTAGLEFAACGIKVVVAGRPFYSDNGFTFDAHSVPEYFATLNNLDKLPDLNPRQIREAQCWLGLFDHFSVKSEIITEEVLKHVWGYQVPKDLDKSFEILTANLKKKNPQDEFLYKQILQSL